MNVQKIRGLGGRLLEPEELERLQRKLQLPEQLIDILTHIPLIGLRFSLSDNQDASGLGVELQWMDVSQMLGEATEVYPGIVAVARGYVPVGVCLEGTGDPYFFRCSDGAIVRIPHDVATETELDEARVEVVAQSLESLIEAAVIEAPWIRRR